MRPVRAPLCLASVNAFTTDADVTRMRVIVVDEDSATRAMLTRMLHAQDFAVVGSAATGAKALALVKRQNPHLMLVGANVADMSALDILRRAKADYPDLGVTVLFDGRNYEVMGELIEQGASGVLAVPVNTNVLMAELRRAGTRCVARQAAESILAFEPPESERYLRALPGQSDYLENVHPEPSSTELLAA